YASSLFRRFFKEQGITIQGQNRYKVVPTTAKEILTYESRPLNMIITDLNRISNNFVAEQILKTMAAELKSIPGTTDNGLKILTEFLKEAGVSGNYQLVNGSGLSPDNLMTAAQFIEVLKFGYRHFEFFPEYISSMGIVGVDGTVNMRLRGTIAAGRVRAKTGSLTGVSALSGYLNTLSNETVAFSMIMNDPFDRDQLMQRFQDEILLNLCELK
ncbi:MAG: D-alanyl-D-alanine carboxypeptidase/D-alanyl-D-alanine-endopeptidase, partial [Deltaproteobacteria bacterium]